MSIRTWLTLDQLHAVKVEKDAATAKWRRHGRRRGSLGDEIDLSC